MVNARDISRQILFCLVVVLIPILGNAQPFPEQNINMVSGTGWPGGDPFLRQQNEGSMAVCKGRNPLHLLAAANDYRTVDIPFNAPARPDDEDTGDAWIGIFRSKDGGNRWSSTLLDGYPQLTNSTSPLKGFQAAADPVVRAGDNGMFYVAGIVLNRGNNPLGGVFVARFIDSNRTEVGDPIEYVDTNLVDKGTSGQFIDKPWLFVAPGANGGQCTVNGQTFAAQNIYLAYSVFLGNDNNIHTKILFAKSANCGATWDPIKLSETFTINQGATIAVDPTSGAIYVIWRRFHGGNDPDSIIMAKSTNGGATFTKGTVVANITPFEQGTTTAAIRTNAYPTAAVDSSGRVHIAWSQRDANGFGRIVLITSTDGGTTWSAPRQVDSSTDPGHQFMPAMTFVGGKLTLAWYDLRQDHTIGTYAKSLLYPGFYDESRALVGNLALGQPQVVFWNFLADVSPTAMSPKLVRRHTLDVRVAEGDPAAPMMAFTSVRVSRYKFGSAPPHTTIQDLQINPPNLPMFRQGTVPFLGDYLDIAAYVNSGQGTNALSVGSAASSSVASKVRHVVWTDNRDVRVPLGAPPDWTKYTPVHSPALGGTSKFDPTQTPPPCDVTATGSRNQNIYTTRVTDGLFAGSPGNAKPLGVIQRAFAVFVQDARNTTTPYRLSFAPLPAGVSASFLQFGAPLTVLDVTVPPHSTATRTVFVTGPAHSRVDVNIREINMAGGGGIEVPGGLSSVIGLNTDPSNPDIGNTDPGNPDIGNAEVFNPDIGNPDIGNPDIGNPDIGNPDIGNPDIGNPDIGNPDIGNPDIGNPDIGNPDIGNPDIGNPDIGNSDLQNGAATDTTWTAKNQGNTTGGFTVKLLKNGAVPPGFHTQLILNKTYDTPVARDCNLGVEHHRQIIANINNPTFADIASLTDPSLTDSSDKSATMWLAPGETGRITFRVVDPNRFDNITFDAATAITPVVIAQSVNTQDAGPEGGTPRISLTITTMSFPDAVVGQQYSKTLEAIGGVGARTWSATGLPAGLTLNGATGVISGAPQAAGTSLVTIQVTDSAATPHTRSKTLTLRVFDPLVITNESLPIGTVGQAYNATLAATGGLAPRSFSIDSGTLPAGLSLGTNGAITGTPSAAGTSTVTFAVTDSASPKQTARKTFSIRIDDKSTFVDFVVQPTTTTNGASMTPAPVVRVRDAAGAVLPGVQVTLNLGANPGDAGFPTQTAVTDVQGLAQFAQIVINNQAVGYTLVATASPIGFSAGSATSVAFDITSAIPGTVAAGFGQLVVIPIPTDSGFPPPSTWASRNLKVTFLQGTASPRGFAFEAPSNSKFFYARLPFQGDGVENGSLSPGSARVHITWDTGALADVPIKVSTTPGKPVIRFAVELNAPPVESDPCGSGFVSEAPASSPITTVTPGQGIGISAFGTDTTNAVAVFKQGTTTIEVSSLCALSSASPGLVGTFAVPKSLATGSVFVSIKTSVNGVFSPLSGPIELKVVPAAGFRCIGGTFELFNNWNTAAVDNNGTPPSFNVADQRHNTGRYCLDSIADYHWNGGNGATPGTIGLTLNERPFGPWPAVGSPGQGGAPNVNWTARPPGKTILRNGFISVDDSDPQTWSQNATSQGKGFSKVIVFEAVPTAYPLPGFWSQQSSTPTPITGHAVGAVNGKLYSFGGESNTAFSAPTFAFDPTTTMWSTKTAMPAPRKNLAAGVVNGLIYVVGGDNNDVHLGTNEAYNPATDSWSTKAEMPSIRSGHAIGVVGGTLYAIGGYNATTLFNAVEAYDPATNTWSTKAPMPTRRRNLAVAVAGGTLYAIGGLDNSAGDVNLATVEAYDPVTNTWSTKTPMPTARRGLSAAVINGIIYAIGGYTNAATATVEAYNPATNTWTTVSSMPNARYSFGAAELGGLIYAVGGINSGNVIFNAVDAYSP